MKKMKLATKTAIIITALLIVVFSILVGYTILSTQTVIGNTIDAEFDTISRLNGLQVQQIIDDASSAATDMQNYLVKAYKQSGEETPKTETPTPKIETPPPAGNTEQGEGTPIAPPVSVDKGQKYYSDIYDGVEITKLSSDVEKYILETARNTAVTNSDIVALGAMFEPYKFDANIRDYSFYVTENDADKDIQPFAKYEDYSKEEYYALAAQKKTTVFTNPYEYNGITMVSFATPIIYNNELQGVIMADINVSNFSKVKTANDRYKSMYSTIYNQDRIIVYDTEDAGDIGKTMDQFYANADELATVVEKMTKGEAFTIETTRENGRKVSRYFNPIKAGDSYWWTLTALNSTDKNEAVIRTVLWLLGMSAAALFVIVCTTIFVLRRMLNPIQGVVKAAEEISKGNFNIHLEAKSEDEIGILTRTFDNTANTLRLVISDISNVLNNIANKNLDIASSANYTGDLVQIETSMVNIIASLNEVMGNINNSADQVASGSEQVSSGAQALSQGATEQASSVEELSATITEISEQIKKNAENAKIANKESTASGDKVEDSNKQMKDMIFAIQEISNKSGQIGKIIKTIEDIAFQTNILALNAAVEAARAGSAGKGFAVVADEVRNLATKSSEAAKNTTALIGETIKAVEDGNRIADSTAASMLTVVESTKKVSSLVDMISNASNEQAASISQVTMGVEQISAVVQTNSATAEESAASSEELSGQAAILKQLVSEFKLKNSDNGAVKRRDNFKITNINLDDDYYSTSNKY